MNIKQVEQLTGITSKNIRFYEGAGLLRPHRNEQNGYREYSDEDVRRVKVIKMLRKMDISVESIREVLDGQQPLDTLLGQQYDKLEQSIRQMEAAKQICKALKSDLVDIATLDVDAYLEKIETLEQEGERFSDIMDDFKQVVAAVAKRRITFYPDEIILTTRQFTNVLLKYAEDFGHDITITKESMSPEFTLDGLPYKAWHINARFGSRVFANIMDASLLDTPDVPPKRRRWMELVWKYVLPICLWILFLLYLLRYFIFYPSTLP